LNNGGETDLFLFWDKKQRRKRKERNNQWTKRKYVKRTMKMKNER